MTEGNTRKIPDQDLHYPIIPDWLNIWWKYPYPIHTRSVPKYFFQYPNPIRPEVENPYPLGPVGDLTSGQPLMHAFHRHVLYYDLIVTETDGGDTKRRSHGQQAFGQGQTWQVSLTRCQGHKILWAPSICTLGTGHLAHVSGTQNITETRHLGRQWNLTCVRDTKYCGNGAWVGTRWAAAVYIYMYLHFETIHAKVNQRHEAVKLWAFGQAGCSGGASGTW